MKPSDSKAREVYCICCCRRSQSSPCTKAVYSGYKQYARAVTGCLHKHRAWLWHSLLLWVYKQSPCVHAAVIIKSGGSGGVIYIYTHTRVCLKSCCKEGSKSKAVFPMHSATAQCLCLPRARAPQPQGSTGHPGSGRTLPALLQNCLISL